MRGWILWLYNLPLLLFVFLLLLVPVMGTFFLSFFRDVVFLEREFVGLENYSRLLKDSHFLTSLVFTLKFTLFSVILEVVLGLFIALVINEKVPLRGILRGIVLVPWAIPSVVSARVWQLMFNYSYGFLNYLSVTLFGERVNWLGGELSAFISLVIADAWRTTPFVALILLAGLQSIPEEIYSQAKVDGAGMFKRFFSLTLPLLKPFLLVAVLFRSVDALRVFDIVFVLTGGGPGGSTTPVSLYAYKLYLMGDFGYASAVSTSLFLIALLISISLARRLRGGWILE